MSTQARTKSNTSLPVDLPPPLTWAQKKRCCLPSVRARVRCTCVRAPRACVQPCAASPAVRILHLEVILLAVERLVPKVFPITLFARIDGARMLAIDLLGLCKLCEAPDDSTLRGHTELQLVRPCGIVRDKVEEAGAQPAKAGHTRPCHDCTLP